MQCHWIADQSLAKQGGLVIATASETIPNSASVASRFEQGLNRQSQMCDALEELADSLPIRVDTSAALLLVNRLHPLLRQCHDLEENLVFPILITAQSDLTLMLDRLRKEHFEDQDHACDVRDSVKTFVKSGSRTEAREIAYMLRSMFVPLRRHLAFDQHHILPLFRRSCGL